MTSHSVLECITTPRATSWQRPSSGLNNKRSPSICKPWKPALPLSGLLSYPRSISYGSFHLISQIDFSNIPMDRNHLSPPAGPDKSSNEASPLLRSEHPSRPYQAYCVTEASSRPPSPDALIPRPMRLRDHGPRYSRNASLNPSTPASIDQSRSIAAVVSGLENKSDGKRKQSNGSHQLRSTMLDKSNHITQAVNPRGSHPLKGVEPTRYDRTPSQLRMQRATPENVATTSTCRRKPLPHHASNTSMIHRPLPPLPLEIEPLRAAVDVQYASHNADIDGINREQPWWALPPCSGSEKTSEGLHSNSHGVLQISRKTEIDQRQAVHATKYRLNTTKSYESLNPHSNAALSPTWTVLGGNVQMASTSEPNEPRGLPSEMDDDRRAFRRTQPKDAKFKYQFGRRPAVRVDKAPTPPLHQYISVSSINLGSPTSSSTREADDPTHVDYLSSSPSSRPHAGGHAGPRPPPWGCSDNLELRRQTRSEAREREEARRYRMTVDSGSSIYKGSDSTDSLRQNTMRREVEQYREQMLQLYPDIAFDGTAGKGGRSCFCVVM